MAKDARGHGSEARGGTTPVQSENQPFKSRLSGPSFLDPHDPRAAHQSGVDQVGRTMTRQHFNLIASTLAQHAQQVRTDPHAHNALVSSFADKLAGTNPNFDRDRFKDAAGYNRKV